MTKQRSVVKTIKHKTQFVKRTRNSYSVSHKKEVIAYAKNHGNNQAARHFDIDCGGAGETVSGNLRRASLSDVCLWVKRSWEGISTDIVVKFFKTCNISNDLDSDDVSDNNGVNDDHDDDNATDFVIGEDDIIDIIDETHITD